MSGRQAKRVVITGVVLLPVLLFAAVFAWNVRKTDQQRREALAALGTPATVQLYTDLQTVKKSPTLELLDKSYNLAGFQFTLAEALDHIYLANDIFEALEYQVNQQYGEDFADLRIDPRDYTKQDYRELEKSLIPYQHIYQQALDLSQIPGPYYLIELTDRIDPDLHDIPHAQMLAQLLMRFATIQAQRGEYERATESITAAIRTGDKLVLEPLLLSLSTRHYIHKEIIKVAGHILPTNNFSESARLQFAQLPDPVRYRKPYADSMRILSIQLSGSLDSVRNYEKNAVRNILPGEKHTLATIFYFSPLGRAIMNRDEFHSHTIIHEGVQEIEDGTYGHRVFQQSVEERYEQLPERYTISRNVFFLVSETFDLQLEIEAEIRLLKLGLAIEAHLDEVGELPETLEEAAGRYSLNSTDPFTGESLRYTPDGDEFLLYSLGQNETDEGGIHSFGSDIVWRGQEASMNQATIPLQRL